jgi:hypothetical protein
LYVKETEFDHYREWLNENGTLDNFKDHIFYNVLEYEILRYGSAFIWFESSIENATSLQVLEQAFIVNFLNNKKF